MLLNRIELLFTPQTSLIFSLLGSQLVIVVLTAFLVVKVVLATVNVVIIHHRVMNECVNAIPPSRAEFFNAVGHDGAVHVVVRASVRAPSSLVLLLKQPAPLPLVLWPCSAMTPQCRSCSPFLQAS